MKEPMETFYRPGPDERSASRQGPILKELARLQFEVARARSQLEHLQSRRAVQVATTLADALRRPRELLRLGGHVRRSAHRLTQEAMRPSVDRLLRSLSDEDHELGLEIGLRHPYPHLRVGHLGHYSAFSRVAPHVRLDVLQFQRDIQKHLDLFVIEPPLLDPSLSRQLGSTLRSCHSAKVPVVLKADQATNLMQVPVEEVDLVLTADPDVAALAGARLHPDRVLCPLPSVDMGTFNPIGWSRSPRYPVAVYVGEAVAGSSAESLSLLTGALGSEARVVSEAAISKLGARRAELMREHSAALVLSETFGSASDCLARIMENLACGTPVILLGSVPHPDLIKEGLVQTASSVGEAVESVHGLVSDIESRERLSVPTRRKVLKDHSHLRLFETILSRLEIPLRPPPRLSVLLSTRRPDRLEQAVAEVAKQTYPNIELVLVLHGDGWDEARAGATGRGMGLATRVVTAPGTWTLGDCLNAGLDSASGELVAKMDDDDYYGLEHLTDVALALDYADADLVGKRGHFVHVSERDLTLEVLPEEQERFVDRIPGATILLRRRVLERYRFRSVPRHVDSHLVKSLRTSGGRIYSTNRFNFIRGRHSDGHTFEREEEYFLSIGANSQPGLSRAIAEL